MSDIEQAPPVKPLTLKELGAVLIKHYNLHEGRYEVLIEFRVGVGGIGENPETRLPGAMVGVYKVGLNKTETLGPNTLDASIINPIL